MIVRNAVKVDISTANMRQRSGIGRLQKGPGPMSAPVPRLMPRYHFAIFNSG